MGSRISQVPVVYPDFQRSLTLHKMFFCIAHLTNEEKHPAFPVKLLTSQALSLGPISSQKAKANYVITSGF